MSDFHLTSGYSCSTILPEDCRMAIHDTVSRSSTNTCTVPSHIEAQKCAQRQNYTGDRQARNAAEQLLVQLVLVLQLLFVFAIPGLSCEVVVSTCHPPFQCHLCLFVVFSVFMMYFYLSYPARREGLLFQSISLFGS